MSALCKLRRARDPPSPRAYTLVYTRTTKFNQQIPPGILLGFLLFHLDQGIQRPYTKHVQDADEPGDEEKRDIVFTLEYTSALQSGVRRRTS